MISETKFFLLQMNCVIVLGIKYFTSLTSADLFTLEGADGAVVTHSPLTPVVRVQLPAWALPMMAHPSILSRSVKCMYVCM